MATDTIRAYNKKDARLRFYFPNAIYTMDDGKLRHKMIDKIIKLEKTSQKLSDGMYWFEVEYKTQKWRGK